MAVLNATIRSSVLANDTQLQVILPYDRPAENQQSPCKVLYLLHGLSENSQAWCRYTAIERYARKKGIAVIMPEVLQSFYTDMYYGPAYFTYITDELPRLCGQMFHISTAPEDSYVAGLSMGGYGALKCALTHPNRYAGAASFSGAVDFKDVAEHYITEETSALFTATLGPEHLVLPQHDLFALAQQAAGSPHSPRLYLSCGQEDFLWDMNIRFHKHLETLPQLDVFFESWPGTHDWTFWDTSIQKALDYFSMTNSTK